MRGARIILAASWLMTGGVTADAGTYRIAATHGSGIVGLDPGPLWLTWTNSSPGAYDVESRELSGEEWLPVTYGTTTGMITETALPSHRGWRLGFTPFPYDIGSNATEWLTIVSNVYRVIEDHGDIISHHFDAGVPWPEALAGLPFPTSMQNELQFRKDNTPGGHSIFLSVTPIDITRTMLAPYRGEQESMPLPSPWDGYTFNHPDVKEAYYQYCRRMIDYFEPEYTVIGIEVNLLADPEDWAAYRELHTGTYARLKADFPDRAISVSWTGMDLLEGFTSAVHTQQTGRLTSMAGHVDYFGLSLHSFISALLADTVITVEQLKILFNLMDKPIAICETSYPAELVTLNGGSLVFNGSEAKQAVFFRHLFSALESYDARFVINFVPIDYDPLWVKIGMPDDINKLWRNTGMFDDTLSPRPALRIWRGRLTLPLK